MPTKLTTEQANAVYDILVEHAGAREDYRDDFVCYQADVGVIEYRFQGALGFGGKFWRTTGLRRDLPDVQWSVTAYAEEVRVKPERHAMIAATNRALEELRARVLA